MGDLIVIEFMTLDGVVSDPDGRGGTPGGGWAFRHGPEAVAGDKFDLGPLLDTGVMLLGRVTWQMFSAIWPDRDDPFAAKMNAIPKLVLTRSGVDTSAWQNSTAVDRDLRGLVEDECRERDVVVTGSLGVVRELAALDLVDEYRLLTFPSVARGGQRLFPDNGQPVDLTCLSARQKGAAVLTRYGRRTDRPGR